MKNINFMDDKTIIPLHFIEKMKTKELIILIALVIVLVLVRVYSPIANFNPLGAIALMAGFLFRNRILAVTTTFGALLLGDFLLSFRNPTYSEYLFSTSFMFVYLAFIAILIIGMALGKNVTLTKVIGGSLLAAVTFFFVSNFGSWLYLEMYPKTIEGLSTCMAAGLPFFRATLISQVLFSVGIYAVYLIASQKKVVLV